jgi:hypothetical protein
MSSISSHRHFKEKRPWESTTRRVSANLSATAFRISRIPILLGSRLGAKERPKWNAAARKRGRGTRNLDDFVLDYCLGGGGAREDVRRRNGAWTEIEEAVTMAQERSVSEGRLSAVGRSPMDGGWQMGRTRSSKLSWWCGRGSAVIVKASSTIDASARMKANFCARRCILSCFS